MCLACGAASSAAEIADWVGKKVIVLPRPSEQHQYGYSCLRRSEGGYIVPTYQECAGKVATVTKVETPARGDWRVHLTLDENGKEYVAIGNADGIPCLTPAADLDSARARWQGKDVWVIRTNYLLKRDGFPVTDADGLRNLERMTVADISPGYDAASPLRLTLLHGDHSYLADIVWVESPSGRKFDEIFLDTDPRKLYHWDEGVWRQVENREVATGMLPEQVQLSWGPPEVITKIDSEHCRCQEWEYGPTTVYFRDGTLERIEDQ